MFRVVPVVKVALEVDQPGQQAAAGVRAFLVATPETEPVAGIDAFDIGGVHELAEVLDDPDGPGQGMPAQAVKVDQEDPATPVLRPMDVVTGYEEMAQIQVLVKVPLSVQLAGQPGHFRDQALLPSPERPSIEPFSGFGYGRVQANHVAQFFDGQDALHFAPRPDKLARGHRRRYGQPVVLGPFQIAQLLHGRRPVPPGPQDRQQAAPPRQFVMTFEVHRPAAGRLSPLPSGRSNGLVWRDNHRSARTHDRLGPIAARKARPIAPLPGAIQAVHQAAPEGTSFCFQKMGHHDAFRLPRTSDAGGWPVAGRKPALLPPPRVTRHSFGQQFFDGGADFAAVSSVMQRWSSGQTRNWHGPHGTFFCR